MNNVVTDSGEQRKDLAIRIYLSILSQIPFPFRLPHNIEQSSMCYTIGPSWLSILNRAVCMCLSQTPNYPFSAPILPPGNPKFFL